MPFGTMTTEQRVTNLEKAKVARKANAEARRNSTLRNDFLDAVWWEELAREKGVRLPPWGMPCTVSRMTTWLHKIGVSVTAYQREYGKLAEFISLNPQWPMRSWAGLTLEWRETPDYEGLGTPPTNQRRE